MSSGRAIESIQEFAHCIRLIKGGMTAPAAEVKLGLYEDAIRVFMRRKHPCLKTAYRHAQEARKRHFYAEAVVCASASGRLSRVRQPKGVDDMVLSRMELGIIKSIVGLMNKGVSLQDACRRVGKPISWLNKRLYASCSARAVFGRKADRTGKIKISNLEKEERSIARRRYNSTMWSEACERGLNSYLRQKGLMGSFKRSF